MDILEPQQYQPQAAALFAQVQARLYRLVPAARVEHVGSSAVPGACSKGDLDICLLVPGGLLEASVRVLQQAGYVAKADTLRTSELCMLEWHAAGAEHAVQVVAQGSAFEAGFIGFRDLLCQDPALVEGYSALKKSLAGAAPQDYRAAKARFIAQVLAEHGRRPAPDNGPA